MTTMEKPIIRHAIETEKPRMAIAVGSEAANSVLKYLSSSNRSLRQIM